MKYESNRCLKMLNAIADVVLLMMAFSLSGLLRAYSNLGESFYYQDLHVFQPLGTVYAIIMVACYVLEGNYHSLRIRNRTKAVLLTGITNLLGLALAAAFMFVFRLTQFSRLLLLYFYVISVLTIAIKRIALDWFSRDYAKRHSIVPNVLVIGSGKLALRFYHAAVTGKTEDIRFVGYAASKANEDIPNYRGDTSKLSSMIPTYRVGMIVVAEDTQNQNELMQIVAIAHNFNVRVCTIPVYTDLVSLTTGIQQVAGMRLIDLQLIDTCNIMGVPMAVTDVTGVADTIGQQLENWRGKYIVLADLDLATDNTKTVSEIQDNAVLVLPSEDSLANYSKSQGFSHADSISGLELMRTVIAEGIDKGWKHCLYGKDMNTVAKVREAIFEEFPKACIVSNYVHAGGLTIDEEGVFTDDIVSKGADFIWVSIDSPEQESWLAAHENRIPAVMIGVGSTFEQWANEKTGNVSKKLSPQNRGFLSKLRFDWWIWN